MRLHRILYGTFVPLILLATASGNLMAQNDFSDLRREFAISLNRVSDSLKLTDEHYELLLFFLAQTRNTADSYGEIRLLIDIATYYSIPRKDYDRAIGLFEVALDVLNRDLEDATPMDSITDVFLTGISQTRAEINRGRAAVFAALGQDDIAEGILRTTLRDLYYTEEKLFGLGNLSIRTVDQINLAAVKTKRSLGELLADIGDLVAGTHLLENALSDLDSFLSLDSSLGLSAEIEKAALLEILGEIAHKQGESATALQRFSQAANKYSNSGDAVSEGMLQDRIATLYTELNNPERAKIWLRAAEDTLSKLPREPGQIALSRLSYQPPTPNAFTFSNTLGITGLPESALVPLFNWPKESAYDDLTDEIIGLPEAKRLSDVNRIIQNALTKANYKYPSTYYYVKNGFAVITTPERIDRDGSPFCQYCPDRWIRDQSFRPVTDFKSYFVELLKGVEGYYRVMAFVVHDEDRNSEVNLDHDEIQVWVDNCSLRPPWKGSGRAKYDAQIDGHFCTVYSYVYSVATNREPVQVNHPAIIDHLRNTQIDLDGE